MDFKRLDKIYNELKKAYEETEKAMQTGINKRNVMNAMSLSLDIVIQIKSFNNEAEYLTTELQGLIKNNLETVTDTNTGTVQ